MKAFLPGDWAPEFLERLRAELSTGIEVVVAPREGDIPDPPDYEWLVDGAPSPERIEASPTLQGVIVPWAGVSARAWGVLHRYPHLRVYNLHHNAAATAEFAVALLLAAARRIVPVDRALRTGDWTEGREFRDDPELAGKTALILGFGAVGRRVARACLALDMRVLAVRRGDAPVALDAGTEVFPASRLQEILPRAEVLILALPLTGETEGLIDAAALDLLPPGAILVNVARGPIVDESALYESLRSGRLRAAGLDVWYRYPREGDDLRATLPANLPFHELENVVLSPHRAGNTAEADVQRASALGRLLGALARGESPPPVDPTLGY